jgi:glycosyltransferase involved in cell wall biosynthesis
MHAMSAMTDRRQTADPLHVVIATRGRPDLLERTLRSLADCDRPAAFAGTIVVENGERHGAERVVHDATAGLNAAYFFQAHGNKSAALNVALTHAGEGLVLFLDDDVLVGRELLTVYADAATAGQRGVFFGGPVFPDYETQPPDWLVDYLPFSARGWTLEDGAAPVTSPIFLGANWAAFIADMNAVGGFDPSFGPGAATGSVGQERAMQQRLLDAGLTGRYLPDAHVWHWVPRERCSPRWAVRRIYRHGISRGLRDTGAASSARVLGYPRWAIRRALEDAFQAVKTSVHPRSKENLDAIRQLLLSAGYLKGSRLVHRRSASSGGD